MKYISVESENLIDGVTLEAMGFQLPAMSGDHPNRHFFTGVLTRLGEPSSKPPNGSDGHRVLIPIDVAKASLNSLIGMAVDFSPDFTDHDIRRKIGVISEAEVDGNDLKVKGYLFAADFPKEVLAIQQNKNKLGMSFEVKSCRINDMSAKIWEIRSCIFTGAAILLRDSAAYFNTSIAAKGEGEAVQLSKESDMAKFDEIMLKIDTLKTELHTFLSANKDEEKTEDEKKEEVKAEHEEKKEEKDKPEVKAEKEEKPEEKDEEKMKAQVEDKRNKKFMKMAKAMIAFMDEDEEEEDPEHDDEAMDKELFRKMLRKASASADTEDRIGKIERSIESTIGLITDLTQTVKGLITDHSERRDGLVTDGADLKAETKKDKPEEAQATRRTLTASDANKFMVKYGIEEGKEYTVPEIDGILKAAGVEDPRTRMAVKIQLQDKKLLK